MNLPIAVIGIQEILPVLIIGILLFGAQRLPGLARSMGEGIKEFKKGVREIQEDDEKPTSETKTA